MTTRPVPSRDVPADAALWMDAARAVLATVVAFSHGWGLIVADHVPGDGWIGYPFYFLAGFAHPAVMMFFVLSGFWIAKSVTSLEARGWSWRSYLTDRWSRLGIVVVPALLLGGLLDGLGLWVLKTPTHLHETGVWFMPPDMHATLTLHSLSGNLLFVQHILVPPFGSNGPLWSVAFEFWYYLWFAALYVSVRRKRPDLMLLTLAMGLASPDLTYGFAAWLTGAAAWFTRFRPRGSAALASAIAFAATILLWARMGDWWGEDVVVAGGGALLLATLLARNPRFPSQLRRLAKFGAGSSFSLYAIHFPIMAMAAGLLVGETRLAPDLNAVVTVFTVVAMCIAIALGFSKLTEARTPKLREWLRVRLLRMQPAR